MYVTHVLDAIREINQQEAAEAEELVAMLKGRHEKKKSESALSTHRAREFDNMVRTLSLVHYIFDYRSIIMVVYGANAL